VGCKDAAPVCYCGLAAPVCYCGLENRIKPSSVGHFDNKSNISEKKILVTKRRPSNILGTIAVSREKLPLASSLLPVSLHFRVQQFVAQWTDFCDISFRDTLLQFCREYSNFVDIG
jgi:hypothetical protein